MSKKYGRPLTILAGLAALSASSAVGEDNDAEIAQKLSNPVSSLISVPFQANWDFRIGPQDKGRQFKLNFQPVIPLGINKNWNVIVRTIVPIISQKDVLPAQLPTAALPTDSSISNLADRNRNGLRRMAAALGVPLVDHYQDGLGDVAQSFFISPKAEGPGGMKYGLGPALSYPTATDDRLGSGKWSAGPTGLILKQTHGWTFGALATHLWSFAGDEDRNYISATSIQPFISYQTPTHTTFGLNAESVYDWRQSQWTIPLNLTVSQLTRLGKLPVSFQIGGRYYVEGPSGAPEWGLRTTVTFVLPEGGSPPTLPVPPKEASK